jgi:allantoinase
MRLGSGGAFAVRSRRVVTPGGVVDGGVLVKDGRIAAVVGARDVPTGGEVFNAGDLAVMPGVVDTHVHINEPGRTDWEGYETATRAAAAGGVTTLVDMPLNCIPVTTSVAALEEKLAALAGKLFVDCGFYGGVVPGNAAELPALVRRGVLGFKAFMVHSGIDDFPAAAALDLETAMGILARERVPLLVHAELDSGEPPVLPPQAFPEPYARFLASRPRSWENDAVALLAGLCRRSGCRTHVVHLSSSDAVPLIAAARAAGAPLSAETCPHYLTFAAEDIAAGDTRFKCAPPIREAANREELWRALGGDAIDFVVSDHSPCAPHLKLAERGDFERAWGGISGLQFGLTAVWTGAKRRGYQLTDLARWLAERPAALVGLSARKGRIAPGCDADLVVWDPERAVVAGAGGIHHRHKVTPYAGHAMNGAVVATFVRGALVYQEGAFAEGARGEPLLGRAAGRQSD